MKKLLLILGVCTQASFAVTPGDEVTLASVISQAHWIKSSCIDAWIPDPSCGATLTAYYISLGILNQPLPLSTPTDGYRSPYFISPFDICRFDTARVAVPDLC